jgi:two-component system, NarL family, response regulator NreC
MSLRIVIADDHGVIRGGLRALLETDPRLKVVGEAADGAAAVQMVKELAPDILLLDLSMPGMGGMQVLRLLAAGAAQVRILVLTVHEDETLAREALRLGACGYITKRAAESELLTAIHAIGRGDLYVHPALTRILLKNLSPQTPSPMQSEDTLTLREVDVIRLLARGFTNRQIAERLQLSVRTVEGHRARVMDKLRLNTRVELIEYAEAHGLLVNE